MSVVGEDTPTSREVSTATQLVVNGMTCQNCARHVREAIASVPGVSTALVDLDQHRATVRWVPEVEQNVEAIVRAVNQAGYEAAVAAPEKISKRRGRFRGWSLNLAIGVPVTIALALGEWALGLALERWFQWLAFSLATVVQIFCGARFYRGAWQQLKARSSNMDTLVALGSTTAYVYSLWALFLGRHVYFMEATAIITLISVGHWMESRMTARAASSMRKLLALAPAQARRRNPGGVDELVSLSALRVGDLVVLRPGERVPTDGQVVEGESAVDESMLTGESVPVEKAPGTTLYGGTMNLNRLLVMRVTATGEATALAQIIAAVERAQNSRANIQRLGDRVSSVFVPIVVLVAIATALWWGFAYERAAATFATLSHYAWHAVIPASALAAAAVNCAAVLIIACPCAMGLATPAAIMAGTNAAAERGILIRDGVALEKAGMITSVVFDKTGTLTQGKPEVAAHAVFSPGPAIAIARSLAAHSNHPLSQAMVRGLPDPHLPSQHSEITRKINGWQERAGAGIEAFFEEQPIRLGSIHWLLAAGIDPAPANAFVENWTGDGASIVALAHGTQLLAAFALRDPLKDGAPEAVRSFQAAGQAVYIVTGDNRRTAASVAHLLGIPAVNVAAEVRPEGKADFVKSLQQRGERVAFIGDGINDAPALEQADLGIAVGRASDVAQMAADIVLLKSDIHAVPEALGLARATLRVIKQNLFWAFFYNALGIPLAALGFLSPVLCAAAMGLSDVVVIGNALRLRWWNK